MAKRDDRGLRRIIKATGYSFAGLKAAWRHEAAFRLEVIIFSMMAPVGLWLGDDSVERVLLISSLFIAMVAELMNSAIESVVDRIGLDIHDLSKRAKDIGSAAVFVAIVNLVVVWVLVLFT